MNKARQLLDRLWDDYAALNPQVATVHSLLESRGEHVVNDHIALRTFDDPRVDVDVLARTFVAGGYEPKGEYEFPVKHLYAKHYQHPDPDMPKVFISQLKLESLSEGARAIVKKWIDAIPQSVLEQEDLPVVGRPWEVSFAEYEKLAKESEYAAWVSAFGFRANHFTVLVNALKNIRDLEELNGILSARGIELNRSGGFIKGTAKDYLEQSSTLASQVAVKFSDGVHTIPGCYYEFARRYPLPDGELFQGFVAKSADKIFESTDRRQQPKS